MIRLSTPSNLRHGRLQTTDLDRFGVSVPHVHERWGDRVEIPLGWDWTLRDHVWYTTAALTEIVRGNRVIGMDTVTRFEWQVDELRQVCWRVQEPTILVSQTHLPGEWPDWVRVVVTQPFAYQFSRLFSLSPPSRSQTPIGQHRLLIMARNWDHGRQHLLMWLNAMGLLDDALVSCPELRACDFWLPHDRRGVNELLRDMPAMTIGDQYHRLDLRVNFKHLVPHMERCNFQIAVSNCPLDAGAIRPVSEKVLWAVATHTPAVCIWSESEQSQMLEWGFRVDHTPTRQAHETECEALHRFVDRVRVWHDNTRDALDARRWLESHAMQQHRNQRLMANLHQTIDQDIQRQISELPVEFQAL